MNIQEQAKQMKLAAPYMAASSLEIRNKALSNAINALKENSDEIFTANKMDLEAANENGVSEATFKRLKFDEGKLNDVIKGMEQLIALPDPLGKLTMERQLDDGLTLYRKSCPIGVIGVIFEARPDALVQISTLCIKSGNCAILKGGKETANTNKVLFNIMKDAAVSAGLPEMSMLQAESHGEISELLSCHDSVDLLIPRGSNAFVKYIMDNTNIPVMGHADGICHVYVDKTVDVDKAVKVVVDSKTQYTAVCNATETLLIHRDAPKDFLEKVKVAFAQKNVKFHGTKEAMDFFGGDVVDESEFVEYLDLAISIKFVGDMDEAINHINKYGSHHTDCILSEDANAVAKFMQMVDSAGVYHNCSTRFADGFRYGFGAEVGISTGKLHARGPVGLEGLVTYKYNLFGDGHIVADYANGTKEFHFKDMEAGR